MSKINKMAAFIIGTDSEETIRKKIAYDRKTLPQYIAIDLPGIDRNDNDRNDNDRNGNDRNGGDEITYSNILDIARDYDKELQYQEFYKLTKTKWKELTPLDNLKAWLYVNLPNRSDRPNIDPLSLMQVIQTSIHIFMNEYKQLTIDLIAMPKKRLEREIKDEITKFAARYKKEFDSIEKFYKLKGVESTPFTLDRSNFQITMPNLLQFNKFDIFEKISTSVLTPFCKVYDFTESVSLKNTDNGTSPPLFQPLEQPLTTIVSLTTVLGWELGLEELE